MPVPDAQRMEQLLVLWEKQSARLKSLDVKFKRVDHKPAWGDNELYEGRAMLQSPNLAWLDFKKVGVDKQNKPTLIPHERIVCTGKRSGSTIAPPARSSSSRSRSSSSNGPSRKVPCRSSST